MKYRLRWNGITHIVVNIYSRLVVDCTVIEWGREERHAVSATVVPGRSHGKRPATRDIPGRQIQASNSKLARKSDREGQIHQEGGGLYRVRRMTRLRGLTAGTDRTSPARAAS